MLGVDWAHIADYQCVKKMDEKTGRLEDAPEGYVVESNSGQMAAVPTWKLQELLDQEELAMLRRQGDEKLERLKEASPAVLDVRITSGEPPSPPDDESGTFTQDEFEDALNRVSRREPPPDPES